MDNLTLPPEGVFELGDLHLECGVTLPNARIAYKTHGQLNAGKTNAILYPTPYPAHHGDIEWLIGAGKALDPDRYFIIVADQLGNGLSSSPSNTPAPFDRGRFPALAIRDDVSAQHRLVTEGFGITKLALVVGWSMGAEQTFQWAVSHPKMMERIVAFCGTAKTTPHNWVFLNSARSALITDSAWKNGDYIDPPVRGVRAFSHVYSGWAVSQPFYKRELYRRLGFTTLDEFISGFWEKRYGRRDANNLLTMLGKWQRNDVGATPGFDGSLHSALGSITAKATVLSGETDLYFTPADIEAEAAMIPGARYRMIPSIWGHMAGSGLNPDDSAFIDAAIRELLKR
jgi:homoserine O-acetyltransferase